MLPWTTAFNVSDFPSYRKLIRYLLPLPLPLLLEPKSKVLNFSYFFLFYPGREFSYHLNLKQLLSLRLKFYSLEKKFLVPNPWERPKNLADIWIIYIHPKPVWWYYSKWRDCTTRDKCPFTVILRRDSREEKGARARIITLELVSYSFSTLLCLPFLCPSNTRFPRKLSK